MEIAKQPPAWVRGAVVYGVVPPLCGEEGLRSVTERLDQLDELGVDALWISPIQATDDPSAISYAATDFQAIRPDFGRPEDLRELVDEAHQRGMKVLLDIPPNHVSSAHPYYQDALSKGPASPYYNFFDRDQEGNATHYFDWNNLINLNYSNPKVQEMVSQSFEHWMSEYQVDGFRVDAAWGPKEREPKFWGQLTHRLSEKNPEVFLLAEASARDPYYLSNGFDAAYDWGDGLGQWAWQDVFADDQQIGPRLRQALSTGHPEQVGRFLNNNDTGERFITRYGQEKTRLAATLLLTLPGIPMVYLGDEVGAEFEPYEDPPPLTWEDPHDLKPLYTRLIHLRESVPALAEGDWKPVEVLDNPSAFAFTRQAPGHAPALVVLNFGEQSEVRLELPEGDYRQDLLLDQAVACRRQGSQLIVPTPPKTSLILQ